MLIDRLRFQHSIRFSTPSLKTLRVLAFVAPIAFAVAVGLLTDQVLEHVFPRMMAHVMASVAVAAGALLFTVWMFGVIASVQERLEETIRLEERQRLAMKLHDDLIQCAYAVQLRLEATLSELAESVSPEARLHVDQAIQELELIVLNVRRHIEEELN